MNINDINYDPWNDFTLKEDESGAFTSRPKGWIHPEELIRRDHQILELLTDEARSKAALAKFDIFRCFGGPDCSYAEGHLKQKHHIKQASRLGIKEIFSKETVQGQPINFDKKVKSDVKILENKMLHWADKLSKRRVRSYTAKDMGNTINFLEVFSLWLGEKSGSGKLEKKVSKIITHLEKVYENLDKNKGKDVNNIYIKTVRKEINKLFATGALSLSEERFIAKPLNLALEILKEREKK